MKSFKLLNKRLFAAATVAGALLIGGVFAVNANVSADSYYGGEYAVGMPQIKSDEYHYGVVDLRVGATVYQSTDEKKDSKMVKVQKGKNQNVTYSDIAVAGGQVYYYLMGMNAKGQQAYAGYIKKSDTTLNSVGKVHVNYNKHYGIQIWTNGHGPAKTSKGVNKKLPGQTNWKVYDTTPFYEGKGKFAGFFYNLGGNQYIAAKYVTFHEAPGFTQYSEWNPF